MILWLILLIDQANKCMQSQHIEKQIINFKQLSTKEKIKQCENRKKGYPENHSQRIKIKEQIDKIRRKNNENEL